MTRQHSQSARASLYRPGVEATPRKKRSRAERIKIWEKTDGACILCRKPIDRRKEKWIGEHIIPLELKGPDTLANMGPAHIACADAKTDKDKADIARMKKRKARDIGAANEPKHPLKGRGFAAPQKSERKRSHLEHLGPPRLYANIGAKP